VRADMTPQAARIDARAARGQGVRRLCYIGSVLHTVPANMLTSRSPIQAGCELFGQADISADIEVISLMLESLRCAGLNRLHVDLAHVTIYRELIRCADLSPEVERRLFDALRRKSIPDIDDLIATHVADQGMALMLRQLPRLAGGRDT